MAPVSQVPLLTDPFHTKALDGRPGTVNSTMPRWPHRQIITRPLVHSPPLGSFYEPVRKVVAR